MKSTALSFLLLGSTLIFQSCYYPMTSLLFDDDENEGYSSTNWNRGSSSMSNDNESTNSNSRTSRTRNTIDINDAYNERRREGGNEGSGNSTNNRPNPICP